ncbi:hypothetical protein BGZ51_003613 [Haplosporangium sp. Z 767]|nr:hypothetical protein BGZ51_003613 [Haplosporangium sp. Z 767]
MVVADIYSADQTTPCTLVTNPAVAPQAPFMSGMPLGESAMSVLSLASSNPTASRNLTGSTVSSGNLLFNLENELGVYFVFQDISVRSEGVFTLKFSFTLPPTPDGPPSSVMATVFSDSFTIYSAKRFPGMTGKSNMCAIFKSTALSKCFAKQGIKIPIRKEPRISRIKKLAEQTGGTTSIAPPSSTMGHAGDQGFSDSEDEDDDGQA